MPERVFFSVPCHHCRFVASAQRVACVQDALVDHVAFAHPECGAVPVFNVNVVDATDREPS